MLLSKVYTPYDDYGQDIIFKGEFMRIKAEYRR